MTEGKLVFLPKGYRVVPEEPTEKMIESCRWSYPSYSDELLRGIAREAIKAAPPIDTPPVLRWEGVGLYIGNLLIAWTSGNLSYYYNGGFIAKLETEQEARRAAEKALGFPDGLIIEEV